MPCTFFCLDVGSQLWEKMIQSGVVSCGAQPFPKQNSISLNVSLSPMGFAQNILWYSCGQVFSGKKLHVLTLSNDSLHSAIPSCLLNKRNLLRYGIESCHFEECLTSMSVYRLLNMIAVFDLLHCLKIIAPFFFISIHAARFDRPS